MKIKSLLVGASGLVGSEILKYLHERDQDITIFTRKPLHDSTDKHKEINIDFENLNNVKEEIIFKDKVGRIRDIQVHPLNGKIYFLANNSLWLMENNK